MIGYATLGTNDLPRAVAFYDALLAEIGAKRLWDSDRGVAWGVSMTQPSLGVASLSQMIWRVAEQIAKLSEAFELMPGDIIYSGTPENVGPVMRGDVIECHIDRLPNLSIKIV